MVKRYTPTATIQRSHYDDVSDEAVVTVEQTSDGKYVSYEAYRSLEAEYNKLVYGKECVRISKATGLTCDEVYSKVRNEYTYRPEPMTIKGNVTINHKSILDILQRTQLQY